MVIINISPEPKKVTVVNENEINTFEIDESASDIEVMISGLYLTENEDYTFENGIITFNENILPGENINIKYLI